MNQRDTKWTHFVAVVRALDGNLLDVLADTQLALGKVGAMADRQTAQ